MKFSCMATALLAVSLSLHAQSSIGIKAGYSASNLYWRHDGSTLKGNNLSGFHAGLTGDLRIWKGIYLQPNLLFSQKGAKSNNTWEATDPAMPGVTELKVKTVLNYLELPVNVIYKHALGPGKVFAGGGGYVAYGINAKATGTMRLLDNNETSSYNQVIKFGKAPAFRPQDWPDNVDNTEYYNKIDAGLNFTAGYALNNGLLLHVHYSIGLTDTDPKTYLVNFISKQKNRYIGISIGYQFSCKK